MGVPNGFSGCSIPTHELVFPPHFLKIVVEVKASGPPHVLKQCLAVSKGMLSVQRSLFLCQFNFMDIIRLS